MSKYETEEYVTYAYTKNSVLKETFDELMSKVGPYEDYILWGFNPWSSSGWVFIGQFDDEEKAIDSAKKWLEIEANRLIAVKVLKGIDVIFSDRVDMAIRRAQYNKSDCKRLKEAKANEACERFR